MPELYRNAYGYYDYERAAEETASRTAITGTRHPPLI